MLLFEDLILMAICWVCGILTGGGLGCALGVQRHVDREREEETEEEEELKLQRRVDA